MKAIAIVHNGDGRLDTVTGITNAQMTHDDYMHIIMGLRKELKEEKRYNMALTEMNRILEHQNKRLFKRNLELMKEVNSRRSFFGNKSK